MKKLIVLLISVAFCFNSGCGVISLLGTPGRHEIKIPAEFDVAEHDGQKILVLVDQPAWLNAQANLRYLITKAINKSLAGKVVIPVDNIIAYDDLSEFRSEQVDFSSLKPTEIGEALDANMVLLVMVDDYKVGALPQTGYYTGFLAAKTVLLDTATGEKLWPVSAETKIIKVGFDAEQGNRDMANIRLTSAAAHCITRYLYNCPKAKFKIAEDKSGVGWKSWD